MNTEELLENKNIEYKLSGADLVISCLNPEHEDSNPSMRIDKLTGIFNCLSCGFSGNVFRYFNEEQNILDMKIQQIKEKINKLNKTKLTIPLLAIPFRENYRNINAKTYERFNAYTLSDDEEFNGRIIFPILNIHDEIVLFHARYLYSDNDPKYISKPSKVMKPLYPSIPDEIINGSIILVEGFFDMLNLWDKGLKNVVCCFGSTLVSKKDRGDTNLIKRFSQYKLQGVNKVIIMFDGDKAGQYGANKLKESLYSNYIVKNIELESGTDPGSLSYKDVQLIKRELYEKNSYSR